MLKTPKMGLHEVCQYRFSVGVLVLSSVAFLAMTIGVYSPAWFVVERRGVVISEGPWYTRACPASGGDCVLSTRELVYGHYSDGKGDSALIDDHWLIVKVESTTAVGLVCLGLAFAIVATVKRQSSSVQCFLISGGVSMLSSSILSLLAVLKVMSASNNVNVTAPWSRDVTFAGSVAAFGASCLYILAISQSCLRRIKLERLKRRSVSINRSQAIESQSLPPIQFIVLNNFQNGDLTYSHEHRTRAHDNELTGKCPNQPPAYSEIYGVNDTCTV